ncbi:hypothetical protein L9F63_015353, partial [Diploptera punctata]
IFVKINTAATSSCYVTKSTLFTENLHTYLHEQFIHDLISAHFFRVYKHHMIPTLTPLIPHIGRDLSYLTTLNVQKE